MKGYFFPGEAARILGLEGIDYFQLRKILKLVSDPNAAPLRKHKWTRYSFNDLIMVRTAIDLAGGLDALKRGRHLSLKRVERACTALRERFHVADPLSSLSLRLEGKSIVVNLDGVRFEPATGQLVIDVQKRIKQTIVDLDDSTRERLSAEAARIKSPRKQSPASKSVLEPTSLPIG